jgi:Rieske Fe-S protein
MDRKNFISTVGMSVVAVCSGCLAACSKSGNNVGTSGGTVPTGFSFTTDLGSELIGVGNSKVSNGVIVVRIAAGSDPASFTAVQVACTHQGTSINYNAGQGQFVCPNHGSVFSTSGAVVQGPASRSLMKYTVSITGNTLTVNG